MRAPAVLLVLAVLLAGCSAPEPPPPPPGPPPPAPFVLRLEGDGPGSAPFVVAAGVVRVEVSHGGSGPFRFVVESGDRSELAAVGAGEGAWTGARWVVVDGGAYSVRAVRADGAWNATVTGLAPSGAPLPFEASGDASAAEGPIALGRGTVTFRVTHDGSGRFAAALLDRAGRPVVFLADVDGPVVRDARVRVEGGVFLVDVEATAPWTVRAGSRT